MKKLLFVIAVSILAISPVFSQNTLPYSQRMANSQMSRSGSLRSWDYPDGLFAESILKVYNYYQIDKYLTYVSNYANATINASSGVISGYRMSDYKLDDVNPGKFLIELQKISGKSQYETAMNTLRVQLENQPRTNNSKDGGFWHKKVYPHQMWLDGLYMGARFYAEYEKRYNNGAAYDDVVNQFTLIHSKTYDLDFQLNYHGWSAMPTDASSFWANQTEPFLGCSKEFWARGLGWYTAALIDVIETLPESYGRRAELVTILQEVAAGIKRWQDPSSGCWFQLLRYDGTYKSAKGHSNYIEASASSMYTYALLKAIRLGVIDAGEYKSMAIKAYNGLLTNFITEDGSGNLSINRICRSAGLGPSSNRSRDGSADYYLDGSDAGSIVSNDLKGVGPFIMASLEYEMMEGTGVSEFNQNKNEIKAFVTNGLITIESTNPKINEIECFDSTGKLLFIEKGNSENRFQFELGVPKGIYLIRVNNQVSTRLFIK